MEAELCLVNKPFLVQKHFSLSYTLLKQKHCTSNVFCLCPTEMISLTIQPLQKMSNPHIFTFSVIFMDKEEKKLSLFLF